MPRMDFADFQIELERRGFDGFSPNDRGRYVNWGYYHVARLTRWTWEEQTEDLTFTPPEFRKALVGDFSGAVVQGVKAVLVTDANFEARLLALSDKQFYDTYAAYDLTSSQQRGEPESYWLSARDLYVLPPPESPRNIRVVFRMRVAELQGNDVPITPADYDEAILIASEMRCHVRARQPELAQLARQDLAEFFDLTITEENTREEDQLVRVIPDKDWL
jgi:hypothetical protein